MRGDWRRREVLAGGAALAGGVAGLQACGPAVSQNAAPFPGSLLGPDMRLGHRLRDSRLRDALLPDSLARSSEKLPLVILGGGVAGLAAGWRLLRAGFGDFTLVEMEREEGGNARAGASPHTSFPWGAHYLPVPNREATGLRAMLEDFGIITGHSADGAPQYDPFAICAELEERLFWRGSWQEGLVPTTGLSAADKAQWARFDQLMAQFRQAVGDDGRPAFASPSQLSSRDPRFAALDALSFAAWLAGQGLNAPSLLAHLRYGCRDDYGCELADVSAWAGIHYHAGRRGWASSAGLKDSVLTWPEGNAYLARRMGALLGHRRQLGWAASGVRPEAADAGADTGTGNGVVIDLLHGASGARRRIKAQAVVLAMPDFVARHVAPDLDRKSVV